MLRITLFCLALCTLAQVVPSCPPTSSTPDPIERGQIDTTATTSAGAGANVGNTVKLSATADGDAVSFAWLQTAGPGVQLDNANSANATFLAPSLKERKTLRFQVTTHNAAGDVGSAEIKVIVNADPNFDENSNAFSTGTSGTTLIARAGPDKEVEEATTAELSALNSSGPIVSYRWRQVTGPSLSLSAPNEAVPAKSAR